MNWREVVHPRKTNQSDQPTNAFTLAPVYIAMAEMAKCPEPGVIGCTQVNEISHTAGVNLIAVLPKEFELATVYTAAVSSKAANPAQAAALMALLGSADAAALRLAGGFED